MSPRRGHDGKVPRWLYKSRGRRKRALVDGPYDCPRCGNRHLKVEIDKENSIVEARCTCGFSRNMEFRPVFQPVDYYGNLIDQYYKRS